ncbi:MAG TPA: heavy-metal-associated domain-containing protein [bacterium]|jgi:hypothetical protein
MKLPRYILPLLVLATLLGGYVLRSVFTQPTTNISLGGKGGQKISCTVQGLKCKGTAAFLTRLYEETPGVAAIETYATEHRAVFTYDPARISPDSIRRIMEAPIPLQDGSSRRIFTCLSMK